MRFLSILSVFLLCAAGMIRAQSLDAFRQRLAEPVPGPALFGPAQVTVVEHGDAAQAVSEAAQQGQRQRIPGYRVCIFFDNGQNARAEAFAAQKLFEETYGMKAYMVYETPYFKVSAGNCLTTEEAIILKERVSPTFPKAFVKNEALLISDFLD